MTINRCGKRERSVSFPDLQEELKSSKKQHLHITLAERIKVVGASVDVYMESASEDLEQVSRNQSLNDIAIKNMHVISQEISRCEEQLKSIKNVQAKLKHFCETSGIGINNLPDLMIIKIVKIYFLELIKPCQKHVPRKKPIEDLYRTSKRMQLVTHKVVVDLLEQGKIQFSRNYFLFNSSSFLNQTQQIQYRDSVIKYVLNRKMYFVDLLGLKVSVGKINQMMKKDENKEIKTLYFGNTCLNIDLKSKMKGNNLKIENFSGLTSLKLKHLSEFNKDLSSIENLTSLSILNCPSFNSWKSLEKLNCLEELEIGKCWPNDVIGRQSVLGSTEEIGISLTELKNLKSLTFCIYSYSFFPTQSKNFDLSFLKRDEYFTSYYQRDDDSRLYRTILNFALKPEKLQMLCLKTYDQNFYSELDGNPGYCEVEETFETPFLEIK